MAPEVAENVARMRAEYLLSRLEEMDLSRDRKGAVNMIEGVFGSLIAGGLAESVAEALDRSGQGEAAAEVRALGSRYNYASLEDWWTTTAYPDEIQQDDMLFSTKPVRLKRVALEAFAAARKTVRTQM